MTSPESEYRLETIDAQLRAKFETLQRQKAALVSEYGSWTSERLKLRPDPASWSVLDIFDHLAKTEKGIFATVESNLPDGHTIRLRDRVGTIFMDLVMRSSMRVKVPAASKQVLPDNKAELPQVLAAWDRERAKMAGTLSRVNSSLLSRGVFCHPVSGWMTVLQTLGFLSSHITHHQHQLARLKRAGQTSRGAILLSPKL